MSAPPPDRMLMRAVAEVVINEEKARIAADRELAAEMEQLRLRNGELNGTVPPELAEQIKQAIHLLHESPPIVQLNAPPRSASPLPPPRPSRIERNENGGYTLIYDEPQP